MKTKEKKTAILKTTRKDVFYVDVKLVKIIDGFNVRIDYGNMDSLVASIRENGVKVPLIAYKDNEFYYVVDGHRRLKACQTLVDDGVEEMRVPIITDLKSIPPEQKVLNMLLFNDGKKLNPLEEAEAINRLLNYGLTEKEIAKKSAKSCVYISNLKLLQNSPAKVKQLIRDEVISATLAMKILRETDDYENAIKVFENAVNYMSKKRLSEDEQAARQRELDEQKEQDGADGKDIDFDENEPITDGSIMGEKASENGTSSASAEDLKITQKDIDASQEKYNSFSAIKKLFKLIDKQNYVIRESMTERFIFAKQLAEGKLSGEELFEMFVEQEDVDEE